MRVGGGGGVAGGGNGGGGGGGGKGTEDARAFALSQRSIIRTFNYGFSGLY